MNCHFSLFAFALGAGLAFAAPARAQINVNINTPPTAPPAWGPAAPAGTQYYYIPEIDGYYDLYARQYIVLRSGQWVPVAVVNGYDPRAFHPVVLDYRGRQPWMYVRDHRARYPRTVVVVRGHGNPHGLPPGQAKKLYREGYREGRNDDRRDDRGDDRRDDRDDDRGHGHGNGHGHGRRD